MVVSVIDAVVRVHRPSVVELDLTSLSFLSCCAVTALVKARKRLRAAGRRLEVTHPHGEVLRVLALTNTWDIVQAPAQRHAVHPAGDPDTLPRRRPTSDTDVQYGPSATRAADDRRLRNRPRVRYATDERTGR